MAYKRPYRRPFTFAPEYDTGERWVVFWETRRPESGNWSETVEKSQAGATERAKHFLRLGFLVFQITGPAGDVFMTQEEITQRLQSPSAVKTLRMPDEPPTAST